MNGGREMEPLKPLNAQQIASLKAQRIIHDIDVVLDSHERLRQQLETTKDELAQAQFDKDYLIQLKQQLEQMTKERDKIEAMNANLVMERAELVLSKVGIEQENARLREACGILKVELTGHLKCGDAYPIDGWPSVKQALEQAQRALKGED